MCYSIGDRVCHEDNCGICQITCPCGKDAVACSGTERGPGKPWYTKILKQTS